MTISYSPRRLYPDEERVLNKLKPKLEKEKASHIKYYHFIVAAIVGTVSMYTANLINGGFFSVLLGTLSIISMTFIVFAPYELYKKRRSQKTRFRDFAELVQSGTVNTCAIKAKRIALAEEYEDESELYIVECDDGDILYVWDIEYNLRKKFPCLEFEIYEPSFYRLFGRLIYPLSDRVTPLVLDCNAKWKYMKKNGFPGHLQIVKGNFDKIIDDIQNAI